MAPTHSLAERIAVPKLSEQEKAKRARARARERERARKAKERERERARKAKERERERLKAAREKERAKERAKRERERLKERAAKERARERKRKAQEKARQREAQRKAAAAEAERAALKPGVSLATHHTMVANKSKNTKPELLVRAALRDEGLPGYRIHWKGVPGSPDICYPGRRVAIFVNGCFWHACPHCTPRRPSKNPEFWEAKFARNQARDAAQQAALVSDGWTVLVLWECRTKGDRLGVSMRQIAHEVRAAGDSPAHDGKLVEIGSSPAWVKRARLKTLQTRHHRRG